MMDYETSQRAMAMPDGRNVHDVNGGWTEE